MIHRTGHKMDRNFAVRLCLAFASIYLIWGSTFLFIRFAIDTLPPFFMAGARFILAGLILYGWVRLQGTPRPSLIHWKNATIIGGLLLLMGNGGVVWSEQYVPSGLAAVVISTIPLWMVVFDWIGSGVRPGLGVVVGLMFGFSGVALLVAPGKWAGSGQVDLTSAIVLIVGSVAWAFGSLYSRWAPLPKLGLLSTAMQLLAGGVLLCIAGLCTGEWAKLDLSQISLKSGLALLYLSIFGSVVAFTAYTWLLQVSTPAHVSTYAFVNPIVALFLGWTLGGERITSQTFLAATVIIIGVAMITFWRTQGKMRNEGHSKGYHTDETT